MAGSPPRVRGKPRGSGSSFPRIRITPACAGKTNSFIAALKACQDHPRVCGENLCIYQYSRGRPGSPPRVRGKL